MMITNFDILKDRARIPVTMTRDSVCAGDDCDAPHENSCELDSIVDPVALAHVVSSGYLPSVAGIGHTWTCLLNGTRIATIGHSGIRALVSATPFAGANHVHFEYHSASY
jgi:hypothetical protein